MTGNGKKSDQPYMPSYGPLAEMNQAFEKSYQGRMTRQRQQLGSHQLPVIVVHGNTVALFYDGGRDEATIRTELYHNLKAVGHLPLGIYSAVAATSGRLSDRLLAELRNYRRLAQTLLDSLGTESPFAICGATAEAVVRATVEFVDDVLAVKVVDGAAASAFCRQMAPLVLKTVHEAAAEELSALHQQVSRWREQIGEAAWRNLYVVISSGHQARYRETSLQYFHRLLHESESVGAEFENRVVYAESIWEEPAALDLLARHLIDQEASRAFFDSPTRMQEDLLSEATAAHLALLLPEVNG